MRNFNNGDKITIFWDDGDHKFTVNTEYLMEIDNWVVTTNGRFRNDRIKHIAYGHMYNTGDLNER